MSIIERAVKFNSSHRFLSHIIFWLVVSVLFLNRYDIEEFSEINKVLYRTIFYVFFTIIASYFLAYLIIPKLIAAKNYYSIILYFLAGSYVICACSRIVVVHILEPFVRTPPFSQETIMEILTDVPKLITHYFPLVFSAAWVLALSKLVKDQYVVQKRTLLLEKEKVETELKVLKAQLNPHFLFNTLNNIYSLSLVNSPITSKSIAGLSEILDHVLYRCNDTIVPLSEEIKLIKNYLELEKLRYNDRLQIRFTHFTTNDTMIAPLILLSLVENAFKHGAGENIGTPIINIDLKLEGDQFHFMVSNSFIPGLNEDEIARIGMINVTKQLQLIYPNQYEFSTSIDGNIFVALLKINLKNPEREERNPYENKVSFS